MRPRDPVELMVARTWADVLGHPGLGVRDRFDALGGDAAALATALARLRSQCPEPLDALDVSTAVTVEQLAATLKRASPGLRARAHAFFARNVAATTGDGRPALFFFHGSLGGGLHWLRVAEAIGQDQPVYVLAPHGLHGDPVPRTIEAMAAAYVRLVREIQPTGPYLLGGYCNGALVAHEAARGLEAAGERAVGVVLVAPLLPGEYQRCRSVLTLAHRCWLALTWPGARRRGRAAGGRAPAAPSPPAAESSEGNGDLYARYSRIMRDHRPAPSTVPAVILWPGDEPRRYRLPSEWRWRRALPGATSVHVPGTHGSCAREHGAQMARAIRRGLDRLTSGASRSASAREEPRSLRT